MAKIGVRIDITTSSEGKEIFKALQKSYYEKEAVDQMIAKLADIDVQNADYNKYIADIQFEKNTEYAKNQSAVTSFLMHTSGLSTFDWKVMDMYKGTFMIEYNDMADDHSKFNYPDAFKALIIMNE